MNPLSWLWARLNEPSTHAALAAVVAAAIPFIPMPFGPIAVAVFGALGIVTSEKKS